MNAKRKAKKVVAKKKVAPKKHRGAPIGKKPYKQMSQELVIRVEQPTVSDLAEPIQSSDSKMMIPKTWMSERQVTFLMQKTPPQFIYKRKGRGGKMFDYVTGGYVQKALNFGFGWNWDFEIVNHGREGNQVWAQGKLTVKGGREGQQITKMQFGRTDIKFLKASREMVDYGNDLKAASTDALKKCASLLGIASDIYGKMDYTDESGQEPRNEPPSPQVPPSAPQTAPRASQPPKTTPLQPMKPGQIAGPNGTPVYVCADCDAIIPDQVAEYSMRLFKKRLCLNCQRNNKR